MVETAGHIVQGDVEEANTLPQSDSGRGDVETDGPPVEMATPTPAMLPVPPVPETESSTGRMAPSISCSMVTRKGAEAPGYGSSRGPRRLWSTASSITMPAHMDITAVHWRPCGR